jgi:hypothetical protein
MKTVSSGFSTLSKNNDRQPQGRFSVAWDLYQEFYDETEYLIMAEVERKLNEPLGGVSISQADVRLVNKDNRFTPKS